MKYYRMMTAAIAALALTASMFAPATAQPSTVYSYPGQANVYAAAITALAPAASATDLFTITGAAGKQIQVRQISCSGISTAAATAQLSIVKRSTANSAGTATTPTKVPLNSGYGVAASATVRAYTANPTVGTVIGTIAVGQLITSTLATPAVNVPAVWNFDPQRVILNSASEVLAVNARGASLTSGAALDCSVVWSE